MRSLEITVTPAAEADMQNIFEYIAQDNIHKADEIIEKFEEKFSTIAQFPDSGFRKSYFLKRNVRECIVAKHYQIIYTTKDDKIYILRVLTGYQDIFNL